MKFDLKHLCFATVSLFIAFNCETSFCQEDDGTEDVAPPAETKADESKNTDVARKAMSYKCKDGTKNFNTKIVVEDDQNTLVGDIEVKDAKGKPQYIPLNFKIYYGTTLVGQGKGSATPGNFESVEDEPNSEKESKSRELSRKRNLITAAKKGQLKDNHYIVASKVDIKSGSCTASIPIDVLLSKKSVEEMESELAQNAAYEKVLNQCEQEVNSKSFQGTVAQMQLCALKSCEALVNDKLASEKRAGARSGFVNKVSMSAYGYYLEGATDIRNKFSSVAKAAGVPASCPATMKTDRKLMTGMIYDLSIICAAPIKYSGAKFSDCQKAAIGYDAKTSWTNSMNPTFAAYRVSDNKIEFSLDEYVQAKLEAATSKGARKPASDDEDHEEDPDVQANQSSVQSDSSSDHTEWLIRLK